MIGAQRAFQRAGKSPWYDENMLSANCVVVGWSWAPGSASIACERTEPWRELDRQLKSIAKRRAALDAEELALIREAVRVQLWRPLGMISMREYLERRMGYGPQVAAERLRVADALDAMPGIEAALETGELSYSAVRELTRIATAKTEEAWVKACRGLVRSADRGARGRARDRGCTRVGNRSRMCVARSWRSICSREYARYRDARKVFEAERGERLDDDELMAMLLARAIEGAPTEKTRSPAIRSRSRCACVQARLAERRGPRDRDQRRGRRGARHVTPTSSRSRSRAALARHPGSDEAGRARARSLQVHRAGLPVDAEPRCASPPPLRCTAGRTTWRT